MKITLRYLLKNSRTTFLNILGLAVGMATFLLISDYVEHERSYDRFYENAEEVFRVNTSWGFPGEEERYATVPPPLAETIRNEIPEIEAVCRVFYWSDFTMRADDDFEKVFRETEGYAVGKDFFKVLDYGLLAGDPETAFTEPASVVLPRSTAVRYFGEAAVRDGKVLGRQLLGGKDAGTPWNITGVMEDQPISSHFQFTMLVSENSYPDDLYRNQVWTWNSMHTYLRTKALEPAARAQLQAKLDKIAENYVLPNMPMAESDPEMLARADFGYPLQPITDIHLTSNYLREMRPNGNVTYVQIFLWAAYLVLFMAIINFVNLATAQATRRAAETSVRKVLGASYGSLVRQHLSESLLTAVLAGGLTLVLISGWQGGLAQWLGADPAASSLMAPIFWAKLSGLCLVTGLAAGLYPALFLSKAATMDTLRGKQVKLISDHNLRNGLLVVQLVLSMALMAGSSLIYRQVNYFQEKELGFAKNNLLVIENDREIDERKDVFKEELLRHPGITEAGFSNGLPGQPTYKMRNFRAEGKSESTGINWILADDTFLPTLKLELLAGENFRIGNSRDSAGIILNEAAVGLLELEDPIGHVIIKNEGSDDEERLQVLGVVKNFHLQSLHQEIEPLALSYFKGFVFKDYISIRLSDEDLSGAIAHVEKSWAAFEPGVPLRYSFLNENYDELFKSEAKLSKLFSVFTLLAFFIAGLGLFGLVSLLLAERVREIGIRKVLGASLSQIVLLLSKQFLWLLLIAFFLVVPLYWYGSTEWLQNFAYRINMTPVPLLMAGLGVFLLAALTVGIRSTQAARANPVEALKKE